MEKWGASLAYDLARERVAALDPKQCLQHPGFQLVEGKEIAFPFLGVRRIVSLPDGRVFNDSGAEETPRLAALLLHYLLASTKLPSVLTGREIEFRSLPGGMSYIGPYSGRTIARLIREFDDEIGLLRSAALSLRAELCEGEGDLAFSVEVLPQVPVKIIFWQKDEEFPARATILYDASIAEALTTEDVVVLTEALVGELIRRGRELRERR